MDYLFTTDIKSTQVTSNLWQTDEHFDSGCENEDDDNFVLKFSTDESDCEDTTHRNNDNHLNNTASADLAENCNDSSSMQKNIRSTTALPCDDKISKTCNDEKRKNAKNKAVKNQRSVLDYLSQGDNSDENVVADDMKKDLKQDVIIKAQKLISQLLTARVILERLPDSLLAKNGKSNSDDRQVPETTSTTKRYCSNCDRTFASALINICCDCNSWLKFECAKCGMRYSSRSSLSSHKTNKCFTRVTYRCTDCNYSSPLKNSLKQHIKNVHVLTDGGVRRTFVCRLCNETFLYCWEIVRHRKVCKVADPNLKAALKGGEGKRLFKEANLIASIGKDVFEKCVKRFCTCCKKYLDTWTTPSKICPECNGMIMFNCGICSKTYAVLWRLVCHIKTEKKCSNEYRSLKCKESTLASNHQLLSCAYCPFQVESKRKLIKHLSGHHGDDADDNVQGISATEEKENDRKRKLSSCQFSDETPAIKKARFDAASLKLSKSMKVSCRKCAKTKVLQYKMYRMCWDRQCRSPLRYECTTCGKEYHSLSGAMYHIQSICYPRRNFSRTADGVKRVRVRL